jgi:hypothetical protein
MVSCAFAGVALLGCNQAAQNDGDSTTSPGSGGALAPATGATGGTTAPAGTGGASASPSTGGQVAPMGGAVAGPAASDAGASTVGEGGSSGMGGAADAGAIEDAGSAPSSGPFPPVTNFMANGPYTSMTRPNVGPSSRYTIYAPSQLAPSGAKNPIVAWTSGGGTSHTGYALLPRLATHGFVVITSNTIPGIGAEAALGMEMTAGIDFLLAENERMGSDFFGKLDETKIAAMGYSMGSLATFMIASDPRLTTTLHISGGNMVADRVNNLRKPAAFVCGMAAATCNILSPDCDIAGVNCDTDFQNATTPVFYANFKGGHLGILTPPLSDAIYAMSTAWLRYKLMSDTTLEPKFVGAGCEYCQDAAWKVQQKNLP